MAIESQLSEGLLCADEKQGPEQNPLLEPLNLELQALRGQLESIVSPGGLSLVFLWACEGSTISSAKQGTIPFP
jgi:hypothetical protein